MISNFGIGMGLGGMGTERSREEDYENVSAAFVAGGAAAAALIRDGALTGSSVMTGAQSSFLTRVGAQSESSVMTGASSAVVIPRDISGMVLWYRADLGVTLNGSDVSAWADQSASGYNAAQGTSAQQPAFVASGQNSMPTLRGHTNASRIDVAGMVAPTAMTLFLVLSRTTLSNKYPLCSDAQSNGIIENFTANTLEWFNGNGTDRITFAETRTAGYHIATATQTNGGALTIYYDGAQAATKATAAANLRAVGFLFGAAGSVTNGTDGDIPELIVFNSVLSAADRAYVHNYLASRYAITIS